MSIKTPTLPFGKMNNVIPMNTGDKLLGFAQATKLNWSDCRVLQQDAGLPYRYQTVGSGRIAD